MKEFSLPLLAKELIERSSRRRTYFLRLVYATVLLFVAWLAFASNTSRNSMGPINYLGTGRILLWWVGYLQNIGLLLVVPAMACGVFTQEKERQTIGLLLITRLSPATIIWEKYLSRLLPVCSFLLISLPLLAFSLALGGVEIWQIVWTGVGLLNNAILLTAIAVACSAVCYSTTGAFIGTYLVIMFAPLMIITATSGALFDFAVFGSYLRSALAPDQAVVGISTFLRIQPGSGGSSWGIYLPMLVGCVPSLACSVAALFIAYRCLVPRAFKPSAYSRTWMQRQWQLLREFGQALRLVSADKASDTPDLEPIAWREVRKRWAGHWLGILAGCLVGLSLIVCWIGSAAGGRYALVNLPRAWNLTLWVLALLVIVTTAASLITQERTQQTLSVLLTAPLSGAEIVRQKMRGLRSVLWLCLAPLSICHVIRMVIEAVALNPVDSSYRYPLTPIAEATMMVIYPQAAGWLAMKFSLSSKSTIAAIMKTIGTIVCMCLAPWLILLLIAVAFDGLASEFYGPIIVLLVWGPENLLMYCYGMEALPPGFNEAIWPLVLNTLIHGALWLGLRYYCLTRADRLLGRRSPRSQPDKKRQTPIADESAVG